MRMHIITITVGFVLLLVSLPEKQAHAQLEILEVIKAGVKKVIKAVDLKVQRMQNETIWLQNVQKVLENKLSELKLTEIADWSDRQRSLYSDYYEELRKVKAAVAYYHRIKEVTEKQSLIVIEYKKAFTRFKQDSNFSVEEISYMNRVYTGIINQSLKNIDQLLLVLNSFKTQMTDAERLGLIEDAASQMDTNLSELRQFNSQAIKLSLQRAKEHHNLLTVQRLYGIDTSN